MNQFHLLPEVQNRQLEADHYAALRPAPARAKPGRGRKAQASQATLDRIAELLMRGLSPAQVLRRVDTSEATIDRVYGDLLLARKIPA